MSKPMHSAMQIVAAAALTLALSACGGGSSGSAPPVITATPTPATSTATLTFDSSADTLTIPANASGQSAQIPFPLVTAGQGTTLAGSVSPTAPAGVPPVPMQVPFGSGAPGTFIVHNVLVYVTLQFSQQVGFLTGGGGCSQTAFVPVTFNGANIPANTQFAVLTYNTPLRRGAQQPWFANGPFSFAVAPGAFTYNDCEPNPWSGTVVYAIAD